MPYHFLNQPQPCESITVITGISSELKSNQIALWDFWTARAVQYHTLKMAALHGLASSMVCSRFALPFLMTLRNDAAAAPLLQQFVKTPQSQVSRMSKVNL
jgi:hypothetical protein